MTAPTTATGSASWAGYGVVATGGAAGIGLVLGRAAAARGAAVMLMDIDLDIAEEQAAKLRAEGAQAHALFCDVTDHASVEAALAEAVDRLGGINILRANADVGSSGGIHAFRPRPQGGGVAPATTMMR